MKKNLNYFITFIHYFLVKFTIEQTILELKRKTILIFILQLGKIEKQPALPKILKQLPQSVASQVTHEVLSFAKDYS